MLILASIAGIVVIFTVLLDAFETVVLPRRVNRRYRITALFYRYTWVPFSKFVARVPLPSKRENFLGYYGPLSLIFLLAFWAAGLIFGYALLQFGAGEHVQISNEPITFGVLLYHSGETFFTLGYGDIVPKSGVARILAVLEAGMGFGFLGLVLGYLPTIYSRFSTREIEISLLDARAGSPPTAMELLARFGKCPEQDVLDQIFRDWERWSAGVLESHLSYPVLNFFRSQHNNQSWLGALTAILDATSLVIAGVDDIRNEQAKITFAIARHAMVDLTQTVGTRYNPQFPDRLPPEELVRLRRVLAQRGVKVRDTEAAEAKLAALRAKYEPYAQAFAERLLINLPPWMHPERKKDNWEAGPWDRAIQAKGLSERVQVFDDHF
ncbi:MAG: potassium channel family protein [Terriglobales bacterium]|jgi:hypothetical protein